MGIAERFHSQAIEQASFALEEALGFFELTPAQGKLVNRVIADLDNEWRKSKQLEAEADDLPEPQRLAFEMRRAVWLLGNAGLPKPDGEEMKADGHQN